MWPMLLDMSRDECRRILRRLELEAYAAIITAFRAQGVLTKEKKSLLEEIASELKIPIERHRAEVRRAVNDEKLATIAEHMAGPDSGTEWAIVGRRLVPLIPRLVPQTAFTVLANNVANLTAAGNARLPVPAATAKLPGSNPMLPESSISEPVTFEGSIMPNCSPSQPLQAESGNLTEKNASNCPANDTALASVVNIKRELDDDDGERDSREQGCTKRMKAVSADDEFESSSDFNLSLAQPCPLSNVPDVLSPCKQQTSTALTSPISSPPASVASAQSTSSAATGLVATPVKITLTSTNTWPTSTSSSSSGAPQKVIIVSSSGSCGAPSILQRSLSVPMVKTVSSAQSMLSASLSSVNPSSLSSRGPASYVINSNGGPASSPSGTVVTISTGSDNSVSKSNSDGNVTATTVSIDGVPTAAYISSVPAVSGNAVGIQSGAASGFGSSGSNIVHKLRPKPQNVNIGGISRPRTGPIVIPVTPNTHHPLHQSLACGTGISVQQKSLLGVHAVKQEGNTLSKVPGGMKILPISGVANTGVTKILPKPTKGSSLYVVSANSSVTTSASQMSVVSRVVPTSTSPNLNLSSISVLGARNIAPANSSRINLTGSAVARSNSASTSMPMSSLGNVSQHTSSAISGGTAVIMHQTGQAHSASSISYSVPVTSVQSATQSSSSASLGSGKSNVIVVQKGPSGNSTFSRSVSLGAATKEFVGKVLKGKTVNPSSVASITVPYRRPAVSSGSSSSSVLNNSTNVKSGPTINLPTSNSQGNVIVLDLSNEQLGNSSILNELLHGSGIYTDSLNLPSMGGLNAGSEENVMDSICEIPSLPDEETTKAEATPMLNNVPQTRVVTLEEAVELFGGSLGEDGHILLGTNNEGFQKAAQELLSAKPSESKGGAISPAPVEAEVVVNFNAD